MAGAIVQDTVATIGWAKQNLQRLQAQHATSSRRHQTLGAVPLRED